MPTAPVCSGHSENELSVVLKRVCVRDLPARSPDKYEKDVKSWHVEQAFYSEVAPLLRARGLRLPDVIFNDCYTGQRAGLSAHGPKIIFLGEAQKKEVFPGGIQNPDLAGGALGRGEFFLRFQT